LREAGKQPRVAVCYRAAQPTTDVHDAPPESPVIYKLHGETGVV
jgi:hypothetical protein